MTRRWLRICLALTLTLCPPYGVSQHLQALGYIGWWLPQSWKSVPIQALDRLFFFELKVDATGTVSERHGWPEQWGELQDAATRHQVPLDLTLTLFDSDTFNQLFSSVQAMQKLLAECTELAQPQFVSGLHMDFELYGGASAQAIGNYRTFLSKLSEHLRRLSPGRNLSVFLPPQTDNALYDAPTLNLMDFVVSQSYDAHYVGSKTAGPVAPLDGPDALTWKTAAAQAIALGVSRDRLFLTFPLYGYEWFVKGNKLRSATQSPGKTTTFSAISEEILPNIQVNVTQRVRLYGAFHDPASGSSYYQFKDEQGQWVEGWFEDWWSLGRKIDFLKTERLGGVAFFLLSYDRGELLDYYLRRSGPKNLDTLIDQINLRQ